MAKIVTLFSLSILSVLMMSVNSFSQNLYLQVHDGTNYRPVMDAQITLESETVTAIFITSPMGEVNDHIPIGQYTVMIQRRGYEDLHFSPLIVRRHELTTHSFRLMPDIPSTVDTPRERHVSSPEDAQVAGDPEKTVSRIATRRATREKHEAPERNLFIETGYSTANIKAFHAGIGQYLFHGGYVMLTYAHSRQSYTSPYFSRPDIPFNIVFNKLSIGIGYDHMFPMKEVSGLLAGARLNAGMEAVGNNNTLNETDKSDSQISFLMQPGLQPGLYAGVYHSAFSLKLGVNYTRWISQATNEFFRPLIDSESEEPLQWADDFFINRQGLSFCISVQIAF